MTAHKPDARRWVVIARSPRGLAVLVALLLVLTPGAIASAAPQDEEPELTLERAIGLALEHNHRLLAEQAAVDAAEAEVDVARTRKLPSVDAVASFQNTDNPVFVFGNRLRQGTFSQQDFALDRLNDPDALHNYTAQIVASLPLWTGGRIASAIDVSIGEHAAARSLHERVRQEVIHQVVEAYSAAVLANLQLGAAKAALESAGAQVALTRDLFEGGLVVESDPLLAQVREGAVRELVIRAESAVRRSRAALNLTIGRPLEAALALPDDLDEPDDGAPPLEPPGRLDELARSRRPDLQAAREQVTVAASRVEQARAGRKPELGLEGSWETNDRDFFSTDQDNYSLALALRVPLFRGGANRAAIARAEHRLRQTEESTHRLEQAIALEVVTLHSETLAAAQRLELARQGVALAERSVEIVQDRYREGLATLPELLAGEAALTHSRMQEVAARRDQLLTRAALDLATGGL
jgi:outer membrane protein TolC